MKTEESSKALFNTTAAMGETGVRGTMAWGRFEIVGTGSVFFWVFRGILENL
jgi:hypothetical protein